MPAIEVEIQQWAQDNGLGSSATVDCPDSIDWSAGGTFQCLIRDGDGNPVGVTVTMGTDVGDVTWQAG